MLLPLHQSNPPIPHNVLHETLSNYDPDDDATHNISVPSMTAPPHLSHTSDSSIMSSAQQDPFLSAMIISQNNMLTNQNKLIDHIINNKSSSKKTPSNSEFPLLGNKETTRDNFSVWYFQVISILATEEWFQLYDPTRYDVVTDGNINRSLNKHLYSALLNRSREQPQLLNRSLKKILERWCGPPTSTSNHLLW